MVDNHWASIGGLDLCFGRWDTHNQYVFASSLLCTLINLSVFSPLADVHRQFAGPSEEFEINIPAYSHLP